MLHQRSVHFAPDTRFDNNDNVLTGFLDIEDQHQEQNSGRRYRSPFLVEIISATDLIDLTNNSPSHSHPANSNISPYVSVFHGKHRVHSTKKATTTHNINPIWTIESDSLFLFNPGDFEYDSLSTGKGSHKIKKQQLKQNDGHEYEHDHDHQHEDEDEERLVFIVLNKAVKKASLSVIGQAEIPLSKLFQTKEEQRIDLPLLLPTNTNHFHQTKHHNNVHNDHGKKEESHVMTL